MPFATHPRHILGPVCVLLIAFSLYFINEPNYSLLVFSHDDIVDGQWWRLISGHFLHTNLNHLLLNATGIALLWALQGQYYQPWSYLLLFITMVLGTSIGLLLFSPSLQWYVGLSGALHGVFIWGAYQDIRHKLKSGWLLLLGVMAKVGYEQLAGASANVARWIDANVAIDAHLYGTLSGLIWIAICQLRDKCKKES